MGEAPGLAVAPSGRVYVRCNTAMTSPATGIRELGNRLRDRREESGLDVPTLAERSRVVASAIEDFEAGFGGLGLPALLRVANALGVPSTSFVHTNAPVVRAPVEPGVVLKAAGAAWLNESDREAIAFALRRARYFAEVGELLGVERLADGFTPSPAPKDRPFIHGADEALRVRGLLPERPGPLRDLARLLEARFDVLVLRHSFSDPRVAGAACRSGRARVVAVNTAATETARRFALAHELGHHILDLEESGAIADDVERFEDRSWFDNPPHEKRANAFAAMLLAPSGAISELFGPPPKRGTSGDPGFEKCKKMVEVVRERFGLGFASVAWHMHNLGYYDERRAESLLLAEPSDDVLTGFEPGDDTGYDGLHRRVFDALSSGTISRARARELLGNEDLNAFDLAS